MTACLPACLALPQPLSGFSVCPDYPAFLHYVVYENDAEDKRNRDDWAGNQQRRRRRNGKHPNKYGRLVFCSCHFKIRRIKITLLNEMQAIAIVPALVVLLICNISRLLHHSPSSLHCEEIFRRHIASFNQVSLVLPPIPFHPIPSMMR